MEGLRGRTGRGALLGPVTATDPARRPPVARHHPSDCWGAYGGASSGGLCG